MIYSTAAVVYCRKSRRRPDQAGIPAMWLRLASRRFAVASLLVAASLVLSSCESVRSLTGCASRRLSAGRRRRRRCSAARRRRRVTVSPGEPPVVENVAPAEQPVKVALLLPLSGRLANLGKAMADAAQMALFDLADPRFQLLPIDDKGTAAGSADAARDAIAQGAQMILGPLLAASVTAVAPIAQAAGVPVVAFSSDRKVASPGIYVIGFTPDTEVQRVVDFAVLSGLTRFALMAPDNLYGNTVAALDAAGGGRQPCHFGSRPALRSRHPGLCSAGAQAAGLPEPAPASAAAPAAPGTPLSGSSSASVPPAMAAPVVPTLIQPTRSFDALLLAEGGAQLRGIAAALTAAGVRSPSVQLLGTGKWDAARPRQRDGADRRLVRRSVAGRPRGVRDQLQADVRQTPPRLATLAYDATALAAVLARGPQQQPFSAAALTDPNGFYGRDGLFRLTSDGLADRKLAILRVDRNGVTVIDEPPRTFAAGS